jgi:hypothetical protein
MVLSTEFQAINRAVKLSISQYRDEVLVVYQRANGEFDISPESEFHGNDDNIFGKYLNGHIAPS